jgi:Domain of Unknown Function (DUF326)
MENAYSLRQRNHLFRKCANICSTNAALFASAKFFKTVAVSNECANACKRVVVEGQYNPAVFERCADACNACATECEKHLNLYCAACAEICRECEDECKRWLCKIDLFNYRKQPVFI